MALLSLRKSMNYSAFWITISLKNHLFLSPGPSLFPPPKPSQHAHPVPFSLWLALRNLKNIPKLKNVCYNDVFLRFFSLWRYLRGICWKLEFKFVASKEEDGGWYWMPGYAELSQGNFPIGAEQQFHTKLMNIWLPYFPSNGSLELGSL